MDRLTINETTGCPETSIKSTNQRSLRKRPEQRGPQLHIGRSLKSHKNINIHIKEAEFKNVLSLHIAEIALTENIMYIYMISAHGSKSLSHYSLTAISNTYEVLQCTWHPLDGLWTTRFLTNGTHLTEETGYFLPQHCQRRHIHFLRSLKVA